MQLGRTAVGSGAVILILGATATAQPIRRVYESDFEANDGGWMATTGGGVAGGDFAWGMPAMAMTGACDSPLPGITGNGPPSAFSGMKCWGTKLDECYTNFQVNRLSRTFDFSAAGLNVRRGTLRWQQFLHMWPGDSFRVLINGDEVYRQNGVIRKAPEKDTLMMFPAGVNGEPGIDWEQQKVDLSAYDGMATVTITFEFSADARGNAPGAYVDDIVISVPNVPLDDDVGFFWNKESLGGGSFVSNAAVIEWQGRAVNNSSTIAPNVTVHGSLSPSVAFDAANSTPGVMHNGAPNGGDWCFNAGDMAAFDIVDITVAATPNANGAASIAATVTSGFADADPANDSDSTTVVVANAADLHTKLFGDAGVTPGEALNYNLWIDNNGPADSGPVAWSVTLPAQVSYTGSSEGTHDGSATGGTVTGTIIDISSGATHSVTVNTSVPGTLPERSSVMATASAALAGSDTFDPGFTNDNSTWSLYFDGSDVGVDIVAGTAGLEDHTGATLDYVHVQDNPARRNALLFRPQGSPNGRYVTYRSFLEPTGSPPNEIGILYDSAATGASSQSTIIGVPGDMGDGSGRMITSLDNRMAPGDDGSAVVDGSSSGTDFLLWIPASGGTNAVIAEEGQTVPGMSVTYGFNPSDVCFSNGSFTFSTQTFGPISTTVNEFVFMTSDQGATVTPLLQEGMTTFTDPVRGTTETLDEIDGEFTTGRDGVYVRNGNYLVSGDTDAATDDDVLVYNGQVVARENQAPAGLSKPAQANNPVDGMNLSGNGQRWIARGRHADGDQFILTDTGVPFAGITDFTAGQNHFWINIGAPGFNNVAIADDGTMAVGSSTNEALSGAIVHRNADGAVKVISRTGDGVDLDGNGRFDDNAVIDRFENDSIVILQDGSVLVEVIVADPREPLTSSARRIGEAILRLRVQVLTCFCEVTFDDIVDVFDLLLYLDAWFSGDPSADIDGTPGVDVFDLLFYLDCWFLCDD